MPLVFPYLNFPGTTEAAFNFYKSVFGGEFAAVMRFSEAMGANAPAGEGDKIMHIALPIGGGVQIMGTDAIESMGHKFVPGNNFHIMYSTDTMAQADSLYAGLSEGGSKLNPMKVEFWGAYFGSFTDRFGTQWMISSIEQASR